MTTSYAGNRVILPESFSLHWYDVISVLGSGTFGVTYLARDRNLDQLVAIKEYLPIDYASRDSSFTVHPTTGEHADMYRWGLDRFLKEARTLAQFKHPNIVRVISVFEANNTAYMVMDYEQGSDLSTIYKRSKSLSEVELLAIFLPILDGLKLVHDAGFIHRDIKPANIYVRQDGSPVLIDFGAARQVSANRTAATVMLTEGYAPPEQFGQGDAKQGPWTDIYALGACLHLAVCGSLPLSAMQRVQSLAFKGIDPYDSLSSGEYSGKYSLNFLLAIDRALALHTEDRPKDVTIWASMLSGDQGTIVDYGAASRSMKRNQQSAGEGGDAQIESGPTPDSPAAQSTRPTARRLPIAMLSAMVLALGVVVLMVIDGMNPEDVGEAEPVAKQSDSFSQEEASPELGRSDLTADNQTDQEAFLRREQVARLHELARTYIGQNKLVSPLEESALQVYRTILEIEPGNIEAKNGIRSLMHRYLDLAEQGLRNNEISAVEAHLASAELIDSASERLLVLRGELASKKTRLEELDDILRRAKRSKEVGDVIMPEGRNALFYYRRALSLDPNNAEARAGAKQIEELVERRLQDLLRSEDLVASRAMINQVERVMPASLYVRDLKSQWDRQRAIMERRRDISEVPDVIGQFKMAFERRDISALNAMSIYKPGREGFVRSILSSYSSLSVGVSNLRLFGTEKRGIATVEISRMMSPDGGYIQPGSWSRFEIEVKLDGSMRWKVIW